MTPASVLPPPLGALVTGLFLLAFPLAILFCVWASVSLYRVIFPERQPIPMPIRRRSGVGRAVSVRDIAERPHRMSPRPVQRVPLSGVPERSAIEQTLWARRN